MEQRTSVMISAILFAVVVAGSIAYLLYSNPKTEEKKEPVETAVITEVTPSATPEIAVISTPTPTPEFVPVATQTPEIAAAVSATAPTGPAEWMLAFTVITTLAGLGGLVISARSI